MAGGAIFGHDWSLRMQQLWSRVMLSVFGVKTVLHGDPTSSGLIMANHQSYLDIWMIPKYVRSVFVSKIEVKRMPLMGWAASSVDTVYVDRNDKDSRKHTKDTIKKRIANGKSVIIFPEGTTGAGNGLLPFKPGMFHVAAEYGIPVVPVTIRYEDPEMAWVGDDPIGAHFFRNFGKKSTVAHIYFGQHLNDTDGKRLMERTQEWTVNCLRPS